MFIGLDFVGVIEAKRANKNVSGAIDQARRYASDVKPENARWVGGPWRGLKVPFVFSSNGRPYLNQYKELSGTWFCDLRRAQNMRKPLDGWHSPEGLKELLKQDIDEAEAKLASMEFVFGFDLRYYQKDAILAVENAIKEGARQCLVAMATGTGKTKTCIALVYRLLKTGRFRRILFLVDRKALGVQAANDFKETRMDSLQTFADIFGIKELDDQKPEAATRVHIMTVQSLVQRVLYSDDGVPSLNVSDFDCIVVDECHRGYLLDRELSEDELCFRDSADYISKYRRVIDYFDAVRIGLTATPALHTSEIFGRPVFTYTYREAVLDGVLVDHLPPVIITTELSAEGIHFEKDDVTDVYYPDMGTVESYSMPDELHFNVGDFNRRVITESFNRVVCNELTNHINPLSEEKTLVFCATDQHADLVTRLLKEAFTERYPDDISDDMILKITGASDKPLQLITRYRNEFYPRFAVTVDLLTTGIDIPPIGNIVFLRKVNSRILFEQMMGRATRPCAAIEKQHFRIFDAVGTYASMQQVSTMRPVVVNPDISFSQLAEELCSDIPENAKNGVRDQFLVKFQRHAAQWNDQALTDFLERTGKTTKEFVRAYRNMSLPMVAEWMAANRWLPELLDSRPRRPAQPIVISNHKDQVREVGNTFRSPEDYLASFTAYIAKAQQANTLPALITVLQRPRELTRKDLKAILIELDKAGFKENDLNAAWQARSNHSIAASILGYIRQAALGDPLIPFDSRVDRAIELLEVRHNFNPLQKNWLSRLAKQLKANQVLDEETIDQGPLKREGGFRTANRAFDGQLNTILEDLNEILWAVNEG